MPSLAEGKSRRLSEHETPSIFPFVRATDARDSSVYWCGTRSFPINAYDRAWLLEFLKRFALHMKATENLREETFLQTKATLPDLMDTFLKRSRQYTPVAGMSLIPGTAPVPPPAFDDLRKASQEAGKSGQGVDVKKWMPDHTHWFVGKEPEAQREDFFGFGGLFSILLKPDPKVPAALPKLPRLLTSHPAYHDGIHKQVQSAASLQDGFLARSKEIFGTPFQHDASYPGLLFVLPLLTAQSLLAATPDQRRSWFELFDAYWIESKPDKGLLLAVKNPEFDPTLTLLLEQMRADGYTYRGVS